MYPQKWLSPHYAQGLRGASRPTCPAVALAKAGERRHPRHAGVGVVPASFDGYWRAIFQYAPRPLITTQIVLRKI